MDVEEAIETARNTLGFNTLKEKQIEAIKAFLSGKDVFTSLPTGYGKSIIYGILLVWRCHTLRLPLGGGRVWGHAYNQLVQNGMRK